jgi:hypothetical protein
MALGEHTFARRRRHQRAIQRIDQTMQLGAGAARTAACNDDRPRSHLEQAYRGLDLLRVRLRQKCAVLEAPGFERRWLREHVERNLKVSRARPASAQRREAQPQMIAHILRIVRGPCDAEHAGGQCGLVVQLMQHAPLLGEGGPHRRARDDQERYGVRIGLRDRGQDVGESGPRDYEGGGRTAAQTRETIRRKARTLLVAHEYMADVRGRESAIQLQVVHAGNTEHGIDVILGQELDEITADVTRHLSLLN